ncbi:MAG TPA: O-antigen ligase family protein [Oligoflexus sp.]|uniref:O-antigen ligase family protein n=1 Tax=Oligoflexus sp. TaxID=1971216 RepID=UPI002D33B793|nr:O-antigen ligase family protein [Oligoflexus sp.]HYX32041.1 O-antigen ligase family protein [Oligoflexus sp.]
MQSHSEKVPSAKNRILIFLILLAMLLPAGAQASLSAIVGPRFLLIRGWKPLLAPWPDHPAMQKLRKTFVGLWHGILLLLAAQVLLLLCQLVRSFLANDPLTLTLSSHLRLLGKQGFYGTFLILTLILAARRFHEHRLRLFTWQARGILIASVLLGLYMLGQRFWGWDWIHGFEAKIGEHRFAYGVYRASGLMGHPLTLAYNCMLLALVSFAQGLWSLQREPRQGWTWLMISVVNLGLIGLTGSRYPLAVTAVLMMMAALIHISHSTRHTVLGLGVLAVLIISAIFLLDPVMMGRVRELMDPTLPLEERFDRWIFWKVHLIIFMDHPWLGTGLANYDRLLLDYYDQAGYTHIERKYTAHHILLQTLADSGLIGSLALLVIFVVLFRAAFRLFKDFRHQGFLLIALGTLLGGLMQNTLRDSEYLYALWTSMGLCCGCLMSGGVPDESNGRSHLQDHQSGEDFADRRAHVRRQDAGVDSHQG